MTASSLNDRCSTDDIRKSDRWIPIYFFLFFGVIFIVDFFLVTIALRTQTGVVTEKAYEEGLAYNSFLDQQELQKQMNMKSLLVYEGEEMRLHIEALDKNPISKADVMVNAIREIQDGSDFSQVLEPTGNGSYAAKMKFPHRGTWIINIQAKWLDTQSKEIFYKTSERILVP